MLDASFFQQLWGKRVDIAANAISGFLVAAVVIVAWFIQQEVSLWYEKRKKRAVHTEEKKIEREDELERRRQKLAIWRKDIAHFAQRAEEATIALELRYVLGDYERWLRSTKNRNVSIVSKWSRPAVLADMNTLAASVQAFGANLAADIRSTPLPEIDDSTFPW